MIKLEIDFMSNKQYHQTENDVKIAVISPKGTLLIADNSYDGKNMRKEYQLSQYSDNEKCSYHIDYLTVLLNNYFRTNPNYRSYLKTNDNSQIFNIINQLIQDGYIVFINITSYNTIIYQLNGTNGELLIDCSKLTKEQILTLQQLANYINNINEITIRLYLDYQKNIEETYQISKIDIYKFLEKRLQTKKIHKPKTLIKK